LEVNSPSGPIQFALARPWPWPMATQYLERCGFHASAAMKSCLAAGQNRSERQLKHCTVLLSLGSPCRNSSSGTAVSFNVCLRDLAYTSTLSFHHEIFCSFTQNRPDTMAICRGGARSLPRGTEGAFQYLHILLSPLIQTNQTISTSIGKSP
jgi:hypothetical protein